MLPLLLLFASSYQIILYSCKPVYPLDNVSVFCCLQVSTEFVYWFQWPSHKFKICWWVWMCVHAWKRERGKKWQRHRQRWGEKDKRESCKNNFLFLPFPSFPPSSLPPFLFWESKTDLCCYNWLVVALYILWQTFSSWLHGTACRILFPQTRIKPMSPTVEDHWITRELWT